LTCLHLTIRHVKEARLSTLQRIIEVGLGGKLESISFRSVEIGYRLSFKDLIALSFQFIEE